MRLLTLTPWKTSDLEPEKIEPNGRKNKKKKDSNRKTRTLKLLSKDSNRKTRILKFLNKDSNHKTWTLRFLK